MAEQFDMTIYNDALKNGSYTPPQNSKPQVSNIQYVGDSAPISNIVYMAEGLNLHNFEYRNFNNNKEK